MTSGRETRRVRTTRGDVDTGTVLCCAGTWSGRVGAMAGVGIPVEPVWREISFTARWTFFSWVGSSVITKGRRCFGMAGS